MSGRFVVDCYIEAMAALCQQGPYQDEGNAGPTALRVLCLLQGIMSVVASLRKRLCEKGFPMEVRIPNGFACKPTPSWCYCGFDSLGICIDEGRRIAMQRMAREMLRTSHEKHSRAKKAEEQTNSHVGLLECRRR